MSIPLDYSTAPLVPIRVALALDRIWEAIQPFLREVLPMEHATLEEHKAAAFLRQELPSFVSLCFPSLPADLFVLSQRILFDAYWASPEHEPFNVRRMRNWLPFFLARLAADHPLRPSFSEITPSLEGWDASDWEEFVSLLLSFSALFVFLNSKFLLLGLLVSPLPRGIRPPCRPRGFRERDGRRPTCRAPLSIPSRGPLGGGRGGGPYCRALKYVIFPIFS